MKVKAIILDWDGTLMDSSEHLFRATIIVAEKIGLEKPNMERMLECWGLPFDGYIKGLWPGMTLAEFNAGYEACELHLEVIPLFAGVEELLQICWKKYRTALVTNRRRASVATGVGKMLKYFHHIQALGDTPFRKPRPEGIIAALDGLGVAGSQAICVGDTLYDLLATEGTGVEFWAVCNGVITRQQFLEAGVREECILESTRDLIKLL